MRLCVLRAPIIRTRLISRPFRRLLSSTSTLDKDIEEANQELGFAPDNAVSQGSFTSNLLARTAQLNTAPPVVPPPAKSAMRSAAAARPTQGSTDRKQQPRRPSNLAAAIRASNEKVKHNENDWQRLMRAGSLMEKRKFLNSEQAAQLYRLAIIGNRFQTVGAQSIAANEQALLGSAIDVKTMFTSQVYSDKPGRFAQWLRTHLESPVSTVVSTAATPAAAQKKPKPAAKPSAAAVPDASTGTPATASADDQPQSAPKPASPEQNRKNSERRMRNKLKRQQKKEKKQQQQQESASSADAKPAAAESKPDAAPAQA